MIFITGPLYSGKRDYACALLGCAPEELEGRAVWDVQALAADCADLVPIDPGERAAREAAGRLSCLLAQRAERVVRVFCGLPMELK